ncbi:MAG: hypothetical protein HRT94_06415 [Alphaproteobacteria bacterium]|nr:hypothetical protein [Alphaproteobacteria bacterium]
MPDPIPDQFTKTELANRLRETVDNLARLSDEIILTYLQDDNKKSGL